MPKGNKFYFYLSKHWMMFNIYSIILSKVYKIKINVTLSIDEFLSHIFLPMLH